MLSWPSNCVALRICFPLSRASWWPTGEHGGAGGDQNGAQREWTLDLHWKHKHSVCMVRCTKHILTQKVSVVFCFKSPLRFFFFNVLMVTNYCWHSVSFVYMAKYRVGVQPQKAFQVLMQDFKMQNEVKMRWKLPVTVLKNFTKRPITKYEHLSALFVQTFCYSLHVHVW